MSVYVDDARIPFRNMVMSHLMADDLDELHKFAERLGLKREWFQDKSIPHYDVAESKRKQAIKLGAIPEGFGSDAMTAFRREQRRRKAAALAGQEDASA